MAVTKYMNTSDVAKLTGKPYQEILNLANSGILPGHKTRRGRWRLNTDAVENYFGIKINVPSENKDLSEHMTESGSSPKRRKDDKFISGQTARKYLKCSKEEFEELVEQGRIQAQRDEKMRWRVLKDSVLALIKLPKTSTENRLITNANHYDEVIMQICAAKKSIKIVTANFKRFRLKPTDNQGALYNDGTPFIQFLMAKAVQGVSVQIICSQPSESFTKEWQEYYNQMSNPKLFEYKFCERNHAKVVIIDGAIAYVGSANVTPAGLGQGIFTPGNFEAGILTEESAMVDSVIEFFSEIWDGKHCEGCHRSDRCTII